MKVVKKSWGKEFWMINNDKYCFKILICNKDKWSSKGKYHYHKNKDETFLEVKGVLLLDIEGKITYLREGDTIRIKPNTKHRFKALTDEASFYEISTHHNDKDSYRTSKL